MATLGALMFPMLNMGSAARAARAKDRSFFGTSEFALCAVLGCLFAGALLARVYRAGEPLGLEVGREYRGALIARSYYLDWSPSVPQWRREIASLNRRAEGTGEPPILEVVSAVGYRLMGRETLVIPRLLSSLFWLTGGFFLFRIARRIFNLDAAVFGTAFFLFTPAAISLSRRFQPDPLMVMAMLFGAWRIVRYFDAPSSRALIVACITSALAFFVKAPAFFPLLGLFVMLSLHHHGKRGLLGAPMAAFLISNLVPAGYYLVLLKPSWFAAAAPSESFVYQPSGWFVFRLLAYPVFWKGWVTVAADVVGFAGLAGGLLGMLAIRDPLARRLLAGLWLGYAAYGVVFTHPIYTHPYYHLMLIPVVALSVAPLGVSLLGQLAELDTWWQRAAVWAVLVTVPAWGFISCTRQAAHEARGALRNRSAPAFYDDWRAQQATRSPVSFFGALVGPHTEQLYREVRVAQEIGEKTRHSSRVIFLAGWDDRQFRYYGEMVGESWPSLDDVLTDEILTGQAAAPSVEEVFNAFRRRSSADYFVITDMGELEAQPRLKSFLSARFPILAQTPDYLIFDLRTASAAGGAQPC